MGRSAAFPRTRASDKEALMRIAHPVLALVATLALAACGGAEPAPTAPPAAPAAPAGPAAAAPAAPGAAIAFSAMTKDQRLNHMKTVIKPTMGKVFQDFDAKDFADFGCTTCH